MKLLLKSKHQRLILKCYPPGKNADKKPNPSELSYLLYYATTRRTKLLKVGVFLEKKVLSDFNHNRTGNLMVSMDIIKGLIEKCSDNLDAFAINLAAIFKHILMTKDLALCQYLLPIFAKFCKEIKSDIFNGDLEFINKFEEVCKIFVGYGYKPIAPNQNEWTILSLQSIQGFSPTLAYNNGLTEVLVKLSMSLILDNLYQIDSIVLDSCHLAPDGGTNELKKLATIKHVTTAISNSQDALVESTSEMGAVEVVAYKSLNSLFDTTTNSTGNQLQNSSIALIDYMIGKNVSENWANRLIQLSVNWIPVSSRFRFLDSLLKKLISTKDKKQKLVLSRQVSGLLSSPVTLISLDVPGTLKILIREQLSVVSDDFASIHDDLIYNYTSCIKSLTSHLYYRNQVSDIITGLLKECSELFDRHVLSGKYKNSVLVLLDDVKALLKKQYSESNESLSLEIWEDTFNFLLIEDESIASHYSALLSNYLTLEVRNPEVFQKPNFSKYITNQFSPISQFFQCINDQFQTSTLVVSDGGLNEVIPVLINLIHRYGINTILNGLPFALQWQLKDLNNVQKIDKVQDTLLLIFLYESAIFLQLTELQGQILAKVKFRQNNHLIFDTINYQFNTGQKEDKDPFITKDTILAHIPEQSLLLSWLDLDAKIPARDDHMSLLNASLSKQSSMIQVNNNNNNNYNINGNNNNNNNKMTNGQHHTNGEADHDKTINSVATSPSVATPITTNLNGLEQNHESLPSAFFNRSFTPTPSFQSKSAAPRVIDLKHAISGNSLRLNSFGNNGSFKDVGFTSSVVSSRIIDDVGSLLAELDLDGELSSDEDSSYSKGRLVR